MELALCLKEDGIDDCYDSHIKWGASVWGRELKMRPSHR